MTAYTEPRFCNDKAAREYLERTIWPDGTVCPHCGVVAHSYPSKRPGVYRCAEAACRKDFTVTMKTVMERSHIALHKWVLAFALLRGFLALPDLPGWSAAVGLPGAIPGFVSSWVTMTLDAMPKVRGAD